MNSCYREADIRTLFMRTMRTYGIQVEGRDGMPDGHLIEDTINGYSCGSFVARSECAAARSGIARRTGVLSTTWHADEDGNYRSEDMEGRISGAPDRFGKEFSAIAAVPDEMDDDGMEAVRRFMKRYNGRGTDRRVDHAITSALKSITLEECHMGEYLLATDGTAFHDGESAEDSSALQAEAYELFRNNAFVEKGERIHSYKEYVTDTLLPRKASGFMFGRMLEKAVADDGELAEMAASPEWTGGELELRSAIGEKAVDLLESGDVENCLTARRGSR